MSSIRTWITIRLAWSRGWDWKVTPIQPWHSWPPLKLRATTVSAKAKKAVWSPRASLRRSTVELELVVEHRLEALAADIAVAGAVDRVADRHVVGGDALRDRPGGATHAEEPAHDLLAGADLGKGAVAARVEVDREGLLMHVGCHGESSDTMLGLGCSGRPGPGGRERIPRLGNRGRRTCLETHGELRKRGRVERIRGGSQVPQDDLMAGRTGFEPDIRRTRL